MIRAAVGASALALIGLAVAGTQGPAPAVKMQSSDVRRLDLQPAPIKKEHILEGTPVARAVTLTDTADANFSSTIWDCTAGRFKWVYRSDEMVHILEGEVTVKSDDGTEKTLRPSDVALFPSGLLTTWHVPKYVKKLAIHRSQDQGLLARMGRKISGLWR